MELLKIRFGEAALQVCDVMLKDMADSKRINDRLHGDVKVRWPISKKCNVYLTLSPMFTL